MKITLRQMAKMLNTSVNTVLEAKKRLGYKKGLHLQLSDIPIIRREIGIVKRGGFKRDPRKKDYYKKACGIIEKDGYIHKDRLLAIFNTTKVDGIENYFEKEGNPLYDDEIEATLERKRISHNYKPRYTKVFRLFNIWKAEQLKENYLNPQKNGHVITNQRSMF